MKMKSSICRPAHRSFLALVLAMDPNARKMHQALVKMKVVDLHPDHMLRRNPAGGYDQLPDPGAWVGKIQIREGFSIGVFAIRRSDKEWSIHEC